MRLEIATSKKKTANGMFKWMETEKNGGCSSTGSPSIVAMSCSTATSSAATPMRLDHPMSSPWRTMADRYAGQQWQSQSQWQTPHHKAPLDEEQDVDMEQATAQETTMVHHADHEGSKGGQWGDILHLSDILTTVFYFLDRRELLTRVRLVCMHWNNACSNCTLLWHHHTFKDNPHYYESALSHIPIVPNPDTDMTDENEDEDEQEMEQKSQKIQVTPNSQIYPIQKTMWHDRGDSIAMRRRNLRGTWTFLNYKEYFIEQCLLDRCSTTGNVDRGTSSPKTSTQQSSGADDTAFSRDGPMYGRRNKSALGPMFLEDKHTMASIERAAPPTIYRHTLTALPTLENNDGANDMYSDRTVVDSNKPSDKVYLIGGLHNTMATQPPELAEDFVSVLETSSNSNPPSPLVSTTGRTPNNQASSSPVAAPQSISSPLAQSLRKLLDLGNTCTRVGSRRSSISLSTSMPKKANQFRHIKVVGKPPHIGKHTSVLFEEMEINGRTGPKILIFGGVENEQVTNNLYHFDLNTNTWFLEQFGQSEQVPSARTNHTAVAVEDYMYVVGGGVGPNMVPTSEIWRYHVHNHQWEQVHYTGDVQEFTPRLGTVAAVVNHKILIYGGGYWHQTSMNDRGWREKYRDMFFLDTGTNVITKIYQGNNPMAPEVGTFPASSLIGTQWFIVGGAFENKISYDIHSFDTVTYKWRKYDQSFYGGDSLSCCHFINSDQLNKLLILGGYCYTPLSKYQVFSLRYKDMMDAKQMFPTTTFRFHGEQQQ